MLRGMAGNTPKMQGLGAEMRRAREDADIGVRALAGKLNVEPSTVSRWEAGRRAPSPKNVARYLAEIGAPAEQITDLVAYAFDPDGSRWLAVGMPEQQRQLAALLEIERTAIAITDVSPLLIPGLLQTADYARAIMTTGGVPEGEIDTRVAVRIGRREAITRRAAPADLLVFVGEAVLNHLIGSPSMIVNQLHFLLELGERPNIELHVLPVRSGWHPGLEGPFSIAEFPDRTPVVHLENRISGLFLHAPAEVKAYEDAVDKVREKAMSPEDSVRLIADIINRTETIR